MNKTHDQERRRDEGDTPIGYLIDEGVSLVTVNRLRQCFGTETIADLLSWTRDDLLHAGGAQTGNTKTHYFAEQTVDKIEAALKKNCWMLLHIPEQDDKRLPKGIEDPTLKAIERALKEAKNQFPE